MQKIVILGATEGVVKAIEEIRSTDRTSEIIFLALDSQYPYNPNLFGEYLDKKVPLNQVLCKPKDFYEKSKVKVLLDKKIVKINLKKHKIVLEDNEAVEYGLLLITDPPQYRFPDIKGIQREGVFGVKRFKDIQGMVNLLPIAETIVIQAEDADALKFVSIFLGMKKEVIVICANPEMFSSLPLEENKGIHQALEEGKLRSFQEYPITEILGDEDVKAVRLPSGKVIAAQMVIFPNTPGDFRLFADSPLKINKKICVNADFKTNIENVLAVHEACELL